MNQFRRQCSHLTPEREAVLARRLVAKDATAMAEIYDCYGPTVYAIALRSVRITETAEDLVQETFIRVWNRASTFDCARGTLLNWIATIARNQAIDYIRSVNAAPVCVGDDLERWPDMRATGLFGNSAEDRILDFRLPENQSHALRLSFVDGLTHMEIAKAVNRPLGTVKSWLRSALQVVRTQTTAGF